MTPLFYEAIQLPDWVLTEGLKARLRSEAKADSDSNVEFFEALRRLEPLPVPRDPDLSLADTLQPFVAGYRCERILTALAWEMGSRITLRQALAFIIIALADLRGDPFTISDTVARGPKDKKGQPSLEGFRENYETLRNDEKLIEVKKYPYDARKKVVRMTPKGRRLFTRVCERVSGGLWNRDTDPTPPLWDLL